jgi:hypothetical protein
VRYRPNVCEGLFNSLECARAREAALLNDNPRLGLDRNQDTLRLPLRDGTAALVVDTVAEDGTLYNVVGVVADRFWHLEAQLYEGGFTLLVDRRDGARHPMWAAPLASPSGQRLYVGSLDLEAGYNPNGIQIFGLVRDQLVLEAEFRPDRWGPADARWVGDSIVEYTRVRICETGNDLFCESQGRVRWSGSAWLVEDVP